MLRRSGNGESVKSVRRKKSLRWEEFVEKVSAGNERMRELWMARVLHYFANKKLRYRRGTARCVVSVEILPVATQQCRNYLYDKP